mmetsp:Transcript_3326/g.10151  ORF Transcript_3326/g.10151 Transcript_3326/m.10151 type:complete len:429 (-) Transcript_3326:81-1367(-)|eukprot:CAMPEP_0198722354 /NCGR_PEP_ID=MMETSP1475-20131203/114_1 /TAXON_ID= ORGANISM="Unidentified sp., Strain CCMP1999" /NCGR_SAMPLE_ID=MMETSP1475 /ASSEMBLY_ACC=CAM_ASM_001111 /LENGTH=428 /DNA_ID=CAMNT_0044483257 /DNA_START=178 /DNA_END=1464 /DNA_ORIENTATION=-
MSGSEVPREHTTAESGADEERGRRRSDPRECPIYTDTGGTAQETHNGRTKRPNASVREDVRRNESTGQGCTESKRAVVLGSRKRQLEEESPQSEWDVLLSRTDLKREEKIKFIAKDVTLDQRTKSELIQRVHMDKFLRNREEKRQAAVVKKSDATSASIAGNSDNGCPHYKRNCRLVTKCCKDANGEYMAFVCRFCHDNSPLQKTNPHRLNRFKVERLECIQCGTRQKVSNKCINCNIAFGRYACLDCKLFDNADKDIYHCRECGLCRLGVEAQNKHCSNCNACISKESFQRHVCVQNALKGDCPICKDELYASKEKVVFIRCGHALHRQCLAEYLKTSFRCPICYKSMANLKSHTEASANASAIEQIPEHLKNRWLKVYCYECRKFSNIRFTFYRRCTNCHTFNTRSEGFLPEDFNGDADTTANITT